MERQTNLSYLPKEILAEILSHVSPKDLFHTFLVCKSLAGASNEDLLWKPHFITLLTEKSEENNRHDNFPLPTSDWKQNFKLLKCEKCYGYSSTFPGSSSHSAGFLLGFQIEIIQTCTLKYFGVIAKDNKYQPKFVMGLYNEKKSRPSKLVASTKMTALDVGRMEIIAFDPKELDKDTPTAPVVLKPGNYWIMSVYTKDSSIGEQSSVPQTNTIRYETASINDSQQRLPLAFSKNHSKYQGNYHNYYIVTSSI